MATRPIVSAVAAQAYTALGPLVENDDTYGWPLLKLCQALTAPIADVDAFSADTDDTPGWSRMLDPTATPARALPWLGQLVGAVVPAGTAEADARAIVQAVPTWQRGTPAAIVAAVKLQLTGSKTATLTERVGGDAYRVKVTVYTLELASLPALTAAFNAALPAGVFGDVQVLTGWTFAQARARYHSGETFAVVAGIWSGQTFARVSQEVP